jgi:hypothetical protein
MMADPGNVNGGTGGNRIDDLHKRVEELRDAFNSFKYSFKPKNIKSENKTYAEKRETILRRADIILQRSEMAAVSLFDFGKHSHWTYPINIVVTKIIKVVFRSLIFLLQLLVLLSTTLSIAIRWFLDKMDK